MTFIYGDNGEAMKRIGTIGLSDLRIRCIIGIHPEERVEEQELNIDVKVRFDFSSCLNSGVPEDGVNYAEIAEMCTSLAVTGRYLLIETLAYAISEECFRRFDIVWASIKVKKPGAIRNAEYAFAEYERFRNEEE